MGVFTTVIILQWTKTTFNLQLQICIQIAQCFSAKLVIIMIQQSPFNSIDLVLVPLRVCCYWRLRKSTLLAMHNVSVWSITVNCVIGAAPMSIPNGRHVDVAKTQSLGECIYSMKIHSWKGSLIIGNNIFLVPNIPTQGWTPSNVFFFQKMSHKRLKK